MKKKISIVLPCLNEAKNLVLLIPELKKQIPKKYRYEIICVDDGSEDNTYEVLSRLTKKDRNVKAIIMHRRFGHQPALLAGLGKVTGDAIIMMDADFQHPPTLIPKLISLWEKGHDLIQPQKTHDKNTSLWDKIFRSAGYRFWDFLSDGVLVPGVSDFRLMDKKLAEFIINSHEREVFIRGLVNIAARNPIFIPYNVGKRLHGSSSYNLKKLLNMFVNGFVSYSIKPIRLAAIGGLLIFTLTTLFLIYDLFSAFILGKKILEGWLTLVILVLVLNGIQMIYIGILGEYIGVIFKEVKRRPIHLIEETFNI